MKSYSKNTQLFIFLAMSLLEDWL